MDSIPALCNEFVEGFLGLGEVIVLPLPRGCDVNFKEVEKELARLLSCGVVKTLQFFLKLGEDELSNRASADDTDGSCQASCRMKLSNQAAFRSASDSLICGRSGLR